MLRRYNSTSNNVFGSDEELDDATLAALDRYSLSVGLARDNGHLQPSPIPPKLIESSREALEEASLSSRVIPGSSGYLSSTASSFKSSVSAADQTYNRPLQRGNSLPSLAKTPIIAGRTVAGDENISADLWDDDLGLSESEDDSSQYHTGLGDAELITALTLQEILSNPCLLAHPRWMLPDAVVKAYAKKGLTEMYKWQCEALSADNVYSGESNLIYSAPTSAGKTFVAEMLVLRHVLSTQKRALIIFPFVSIVSEKEKYLKAMYRGTNLKIDGYYGNTGPSVFDCNIAVCTIEKANGLVNRLLEEGRVQELGVVVVDELHMIGDESRGYLLELLITKLRVALRNHVQIVGMSATLPNMDVLARWLNAVLYITDYRPVPLTEFIKVKNKVYSLSFHPIRVFREIRREDPDHLIPLCWDVVQEGKSVLIFCATRDATEKCAYFIATHLRASATHEMHLKRFELREALRRSPAGLDPVLEDTIIKGIAYHHAGLTTEEREIIENAFRDGHLNVLTATCTLAAGVNLPARRVIFRSPYIGRHFLNASDYKQMKGRAGRKGQDTVGESVLMCREADFSKIKTLVHAELSAVKSCLVTEQRGMKRALLEVIAAGVVVSPIGIQTYAEHTLLCAERSYDDIKETVDAALTYLVDNEFILSELNNDERLLRPTKLGSAVVASSLSPEEGLVMFHELKQALCNFVLVDELHVVYHVTPVYINVEPIDYVTYNRLYSALSETQSHIARLVGIHESFLMRAMVQGVPDTNDLVKKRQIAIHRRFFASLILNDLVHEMSLQAVCEKYNVNKGLVQMLQMTSSTFAGMVTVFCQRLGWKTLEHIVATFQDRLCFGVEKELCELARIPHVKGYRARTLYQAGYKTIVSLAIASPKEILAVFSKAQPFKSAKDGQERSVALQRKIEARAAQHIVKGAQAMLEMETNALQKDLETRSHHLQQFAARHGQKRRRGLSSSINKSTTSIEKVQSKIMI